jgi:outer membrane protein TolC
MRTIIILVTGLALAASATAPAQTTLTLDRAVELALGANHLLKAASEDVEASRWNKKESYSNFLPRVELHGSVTRIDPESEARANAAIDFIKAAGGALGIPPSSMDDIKPFAYRETWGTDLSVVQPLYNGGLELAGVKAAGAREDVSVETRRETEQAVIAAVRMGYYAVLRSQALLALAKESSDRTRRWLAMIERRAELGERTPTDVLRFRVQLAQEEGNVVSATNLLKSSRSRLFEVLGVPLDADYVLEEVAPSNPDSAAAMLPSPFLAAGEDTLVADHPTLKAMEANVRLAGAGVSLAWTRFQPRLNLAFQYGWERNNTATLDGIKPWALSFTVNWPIFNGFGDYANLRKSEAEERRAEEQLQGFERKLRIQASDAALELESARKRVEIATVGVREAVKVLESMSRRNELGSASNLDLLDAQTAHTRARTEYIMAVYDTFIAQEQLDRARGAVTPLARR